MRRFPQRSSLVTLSEINITPLLDLAFVLLIIFVITTPLLEQGLSLKLPSSATAQSDKPLERKDIRMVEISAQGVYTLEKQRMSIDQIEANLLKDFHANPNLVVYIRVDEARRWKEVVAVMDRCQKNGITRLSPRLEPAKR